MRLHLSEVTTSLQPHEQSLIDDRLAGLRAGRGEELGNVCTIHYIQLTTLNCLTKVIVLTIVDLTPFYTFWPKDTPANQCPLGMPHPSL